MFIFCVSQCMLYINIPFFSLPFSTSSLSTHFLSHIARHINRSISPFVRRFDSVSLSLSLSLSHSLPIRSFFLFFFLVLLEEYTSCTCVWFFAELSLSSQAEIRIWFATYCNACFNAFPTLLNPSRHSTLLLLIVEKGSRRPETQRSTTKKRDEFVSLESPFFGRIEDILAGFMANPIRSITKIRKIIGARSSLRLSLRVSRLNRRSIDPHVPSKLFLSAENQRST